MDLLLGLIAKGSAETTGATAASLRWRLILARHARFALRSMKPGRCSKVSAASSRTHPSQWPRETQLPMPRRQRFLTMRLNIWVILAALLALLVATRYLQHERDTERICADDPSASVCGR
jgi:hypothetical protein